MSDIVRGIIFFIGFFLVWKIYPHTISRRDRYSASSLDEVLWRLVAAAGVGYMGMMVFDGK